MILAIFYLQVTQMLPTKFRVNWPFGSGEEVKNRFSRWLPWRPFWFYDRHDFFTIGMILAIFDLQVTPMLPTKFGVNWPFGSGEEAIGGHLGFRIGTILSQSPMPPTKFGVNWLLGLGVEAKNRFSRWRPWRPSWISDRHDFSYFWSTSHPDAS